MPTPFRNEAKHQDTSPNILVRAVARLSLSIRQKLLVAFLSVTLLMAGLALLGLETLRQANERTEKLLFDQARIAYFNLLYGYFGDIIALASAVQIDPAEVETQKVNNMFDFPGELLANRVQSLQVVIGQGTKKLGRDGMPDAATISFFQAEAQKLVPMARSARDLRHQGKLGEAGKLARQEFAPILLRLQRFAYSKVLEIEAEMAETAKSTALAYVKSRQLVMATALIATGLALLFGYAISSSLIWPISQIGRALGGLAAGDFNARVSVPNRDELGDLAANINTTSKKLGSLYDQVDAQRTELAEWNTALEDKVAKQVDLIARTNRLRRFLPPQIADLIVSEGDDTNLLQSRRGQVTVLFADLRGFTAYANSVPAEQVISALNRFHEIAGPLIDAHGGTLERFLGDGLLVLFNAPLQQIDPARHAVDLAREMQMAFVPALAEFQTDEHELTLGIGI